MPLSILFISKAVEIERISDQRSASRALAREVPTNATQIIAKTPIIAMTTKSSIKVKPLLLFRMSGTIFEG